MTTVIGSVREYFLLSDARATSKTVPEDARAQLQKRLALGRQRAEAADALWSTGHVAEGLRLAGDAFAATLGAVEPFEDAIAPSAPRRTEGLAPSAGDASSDDPSATEAADEEAHSGEPSDAPEEDARKDEASATLAGADEASEDDASATLAGEDAGDGEEALTEKVAADDASAAPPEVAPKTEATVGEPTWATLLRRRGVSDSKLREVVEADRALRAKTPPLLDEEVSAAEGELFQQLVISRRHVDRALAPASMTPGQLSWTRASRLGFAGLIAIVVAVGLYFALRPAHGVTATATGQYNAEFTPEKAIDGDAATEWLLPDRRQGSLDVRITPAQHVDTVRLKNSHNRHYNDRATREYTVEIYRHGDAPDHPSKTIQGQWTTLSPRPDWTEHAVDVDDVERIRVNVRTWHRNGGGLAEIDWD